MLDKLAQYTNPQLPGSTLNLPGATDSGLQIQTPLVNVINWGLLIAGGVAVLVLVIGGFLYISAAGIEKRVEAAKSAIRGAITGLITILIAAIIVNTINYAITRNEGPDKQAQCQTRGGSWECYEATGCVCFNTNANQYTIDEPNQ